MLMLTVDSHPQLDLGAFVTSFPAAVGDIRYSFTREAPAPLSSNDQVREAVRNLLRVGGFKPTGRNKPASEYLLRAAAENTWPRINAAVDACNIVSFHSGLPISVVDLDKAREPLRVLIAPEGVSYVFNLSGQVIDVAGLLCLSDAEGPCANAVKDAQRTKTDAGTRRTLSLVWGTKALSGRTAETERWYRALLESLPGVATESVSIISGPSSPTP